MEKYLRRGHSTEIESRGRDRGGLGSGKYFISGKTGWRVYEYTTIRDELQARPDYENFTPDFLLMISSDNKKFVLTEKDEKYIWER